MVELRTAVQGMCDAIAMLVAASGEDRTPRDRRDTADLCRRHSSTAANGICAEGRGRRGAALDDAADRRSALMCNRACLTAEPDTLFTASARAGLFVPNRDSGFRKNLRVPFTSQ